MITRCAVAGLAVGGADVVSVLRNFEGSPLKLAELGDQASNYTGLADAAGMTADYDDGHGAVASRQPLVSSHSLMAGGRWLMATSFCRTIFPSFASERGLPGLSDIP